MKIKMFLVVLSAAIAAAVNVGGVEVEAVIGSGENTAYMVVNFDTETNYDEYIFAYKFDGAKTTQDAINAYQAAGIGLNFYINSWGFIDGIGYNNTTKIAVWNSLAQNYWAFEVSENGADWMYSWVGVADRFLADGSWDKLYMNISQKSDFAVWVTDFSGDFTGSGATDDVDAILGKPTTDYIGFPDPGKTKIVQAPYGEDADGGNALVRLFAGEYITVKFDHKVDNNPNNLYGIDFIVFHNGFYNAGVQGGGYINDNTDMGITNINTSNLTNINGGIKVSVSQDGENWFTYEEGPFGYGNAYPSQGYNWSQEQYNSTGNGWTTLADPLKPVNPQLNSELKNLSSVSAAYIIEQYDGSAGGTGFDLSASGYDWIKYVKIEVNDGYSYAVVDAVSDVASCGDYKHPYPIGDLNGDCRVDLADFMLLAQNWANCTWDCD